METKHPSVNHIGLVRLGDSASHNSIFLSRQISQPANQQCFPLTPNQPAIQPASRTIHIYSCEAADAAEDQIMGNNMMQTFSSTPIQNEDVFSTRSNTGLCK